MANEPLSSTTPLAEIPLGPSTFELFLDRNQKNLLILLLLLILGIIAFVIYRGVEDGARQAASNALYEAKEIDALQNVIRSHPGTPAAQTAHILLAEKLWQADRKDESVETLRSFLAPATNSLSAPAARASLAAKLMDLGKTADAVSTFEEIVQDPASSHLAPYALLCLGDMAFAGGDLDKARLHYERAQSEFPSSGFRQRLTQRIAGLTASLPTEVDPPPAPPKPASPAGIRLPATPSPLMPEALTTPATPGSDATPAQAPAPPSSTPADKTNLPQP